MPKIVSYFFPLIFFLFFHPPAFAAISFSISNPQSNNDEITFDVSLSGLTSSSCLDGLCYLQAAFTGQNQPRYFGFTKNNNGEWYKYNGSPGQDYIKSTFFSFQPQDGSWSGKLTIKVDPEDSDYDGPGSYNINTWRYSGKSDTSSSSSDNILTVELTAPAPSPSPTPAPTPTSQTSSSKSPSPTPKPSATPVKSAQPSPLKSPNSVLGERTEEQLLLTSTPEASPVESPDEEGTQKSSKTKIAAMFVGSGIILIGLSVAFFVLYNRVLNKSANEEKKEN